MCKFIIQAGHNCVIFSKLNSRLSFPICNIAKKKYLDHMDFCQLIYVVAYFIENAIKIIYNYNFYM